MYAAANHKKFQTVIKKGEFGIKRAIAIDLFRRWKIYDFLRNKNKNFTNFFFFFRFLQNCIKMTEIT